MKEVVIAKPSMEETPDGIRIRIKQQFQKTWYNILLLSIMGPLWFFMAFGVEAFVIWGVVATYSQKSWYWVLWALFGIVYLKATYFFASSLSWMFYGEEIIRVNREQMILEKKGLLFCKPLMLETKEVKNMYVEYEDDTKSGRPGKTPDWLLGTIHFTYEENQLKFGSNLNETDAYSILRTLTEKGLLKQNNFRQVNSTWDFFSNIDYA